MNFPEKWTGDVVKKMHLNNISQTEVADEIGVSREIVCKTLKGRHHMKQGKKRFVSAIDSILLKRNDSITD